MKTNARARFVSCFTLLAAAVLGAAPFACSLGASGLDGDSASGSSSSASSGSGAASASSSAASGMGGASASSSSASSGGGGGGGGGSMTGTSCADILSANDQATNGVYMIDPDGPGGSPPFAAYCEMVEDLGGWTLALKIDGTKSTFDFGAARWEDPTTYQANMPDLDMNEAKLATFEKVPFTDIRLGMTDNGTTRWITFTLPNSQTLLMLLKGGKPTPTNLDPSVWMTLLENPSLQPYCNADGFNRFPANPKNARARIGIVANEQNDCTSSDSVIGFGADDGNGQTGTGNFASFTPSGNRNTKTFGYVMVR